MATIDSKKLIDEIINANGFYYDDPHVYMIVEYTNQYGNTTWGVTYSNEAPHHRTRYLEETQYVVNPKVIWHCEEKF